MLQATLFDQKDGHTLQNAFLNESSQTGILSPVQRNSPIKVPPIAEIHDMGVTNCSDLADENDYRVLRFCPEKSTM